MKRIGETRVREEGSCREMVYGIYELTPEELEASRATPGWDRVSPEYFDREEENEGTPDVPKPEEASGD